MKRAKVSERKVTPGSQTYFRDFIKRAKESGQFNPRRARSLIPREELNTKQQKVLTILENHLDAAAIGPRPALRLNVVGLGGSGKSLTLAWCKKILEERGEKVCACSYTGMSAHSITGQTFHSWLNIPLQYHNTNPGAKAQRLRKAIGKLNYLLIDESSLLGARLFGFISSRLQAIYRSDGFFGDLAGIIIFGDVGQFPPIGDFPLWSKEEEMDGLGKHGVQAYKTFKQCVILETIERQNPDEVEFKNLLRRAWLGRLEEDDFQLLRSRQVENLTDEERLSFLQRNTIHLYGDKSECKKYNAFRISKLQAPKILLKSRDSMNTPTNAPNMDLTLCKGSRVILTANLYTLAGLTNGAVGTVTEIPDIKSHQIGPQYVFVKFDDVHLAQRCLMRDDIPVPLTTTVEFCPIQKRTYSRKQFPLLLAYALTLHKIQGQDLDSACIGLPDPRARSVMRSMSHTAFFIGISRVKSYKGLMFTGVFDEVFVNNTESDAFKKRQNELARLLSIETRTQV